MNTAPDFLVSRHEFGREEVDSRFFFCDSCLRLRASTWGPVDLLFFRRTAGFLLSKRFLSNFFSLAKVRLLNTSEAPRFPIHNTRVSTPPRDMRSPGASFIFFTGRDISFCDSAFPPGYVPPAPSEQFHPHVSISFPDALPRSPIEPPPFKRFC